LLHSRGKYKKNEKKKIDYLIKQENSYLNKTTKIGSLSPVLNDSSVSPYSSTTTVTSLTETIIFSCSFSEQITRAPVPSFIRVYSASTHVAYLALDASNTAITPSVTGNTLQISMPVGQLPTGDYYVLLDSGKNLLKIILIKKKNIK
jgi:hypothetical protein